MRRTIELRPIWNMGDGRQLVQTGVYVFDDTTLADVYRLLAGYKDRVEGLPTTVEIDLAQFEGEEE